MYIKVAKIVQRVPIYAAHSFLYCQPLTLLRYIYLQLSKPTLVCYWGLNTRFYLHFTIFFHLCPFCALGSPFSPTYAPFCSGSHPGFHIEFSFVSSGSPLVCALGWIPANQRWEREHAPILWECFSLNILRVKISNSRLKKGQESCTPPCSLLQSSSVCPFLSEANID